MTLYLPDKWVWDFWLAQHGPDYHIFYLQAPRALGDSELRHWNVSIGHAVSQDLWKWQVLPDALHPSPADSNAFDDYTTWTGSVIQHKGIWHLFYTGGKRSEKGLIQRIGLATSTDLIHWKKHPGNPLIVADPRWYELLDLELWHDQAWRDPWVFQHPGKGDFHAFITARVNHGPPGGRGVIAHARSDDLIHWEVLPPVTEPGDFGHLEVPQLVEIEGRYYVLFCAQASVHSALWLQRTGLEPLTGIHYLVGDDPLGPFRSATDEFLVGDTVGSLYSAKLVLNPVNEWVVLAARMIAPDGAFVGTLSAPFPVTLDRAGELSLERRL
ncbi:MAG: glycosyl hydrolase family 32 [Anaerolineae bacterium]|jgi:beta-fructofuranosidase